MRGHCLLRDIDEHRVKKRSFAFTVGYIYCFRTYLLYLSFRHGVLILYRRAPKLTASERKIVTKETHQGCLSFLFKSPLLAKARRGRSRAAHGFNFAVKIRHRRYHRSWIQPLSQELKSRNSRSVRLSSFSKYVCGRRPLFGFIHYAARRILRAEIILQIRRHKSGYAESLRRIKALHIPAGDFSRRGSRVAGGKNAFNGLASPKEHHCAPFPCSIRE